MSQEARELFKALADIERCLDEAKNKSYTSMSWRNALALIEAHTKNVKWRDEVASQFSGPPNDAWKTNTLNELNPMLMGAGQLRDRVKQGLVYIRCGYYGDAQQALVEDSELSSHLNVFLKNWSYITCKKGTGIDMLLNAALAHWALGEYRSCLATLLRLTVTDANEAQTVWLSPVEVRSMLVYSIFLGFTREELQFFAHNDILAKIMDLQAVLGLFKSMDLRRFWDAIHKLPLPVSTPPTVHTDLRDRVNQEWLLAYTKVPLQTVLQTFQLAAGRGYSELDLLEDLERWNAPYQLDLEKRHVEFARRNRDDTNAIAQELAHAYMRNVTLLAWARHNETHII